MSNLVQVKLRLRNNNLSVALRNVARKSPHVSSYLVNKACYQIARKAEIAMPEATAATIQTQMNAVGYARNPKTTTWSGAIKKGELRHLTTAERIVVASIHPNSNFNRVTGGVFRRQAPIFSSPSPGGGGQLTGRRGYKLGAQNRLRFWAWVEERAERMISARKSSGGFYKLGAKVIKYIFNRNYSPVRSVPAGSESFEAVTTSGKLGKLIGKVAGGNLAVGNSDFARATFWVTTTEADSRGRNTAISKVLQPVWQAAVDAEAASTREYAEKLFAQSIREEGITVR